MGLERAAWLKRRYGAEIEWLPFDLHPEYPAEGVPRRDVEARYGPGFLSRVQALIEQAGFEYAPADIVPNSLRSLQLAELARDAGLFDSMHSLIFTAYWSEGRNIGDAEVLVELGESAGLEGRDITRALEGGTYLERIRSSTRTAREKEVSGVPAWLLDDGFIIPGAQPHDVFEELLQALGFAAVTTG